MADSKFVVTLYVLLNYHQHGTDRERTAAELLLNGYFRFPDVCTAAINFWFGFFDKHPPSFCQDFVGNFVTREETFRYLFILLNENPFWSISYLMDALKVSEEIIYDHLRHLNFHYTERGWIKLQPGYT